MFMKVAKWVSLLYTMSGWKPNDHRVCLPKADDWFWTTDFKNFFLKVVSKASSLAQVY